jgi:formate dehydrogenase subunit gamma
MGGAAMSTDGGSALTETVRRLVARHDGARGPLIPILHDLQHELGYVPPPAVPMLARELNLSRAEVHGVVTFYRDFRDTPAGARVRVCRGEACQAVGAEALAGQAEARQASTGQEGGIDVDHVFCLGNCALGPSVEVNGTVYGRVDAGQLDTLISRAVR